MKLTFAEIEIITHISEGMTAKEIAVKMRYTEKSMSTKKTGILNKVGVNNSAHLVAWAYQNGILKLNQNI